MATRPDNLPEASGAGASTASDDPFEKHINIAIEAQDGKAPDTNTETKEDGNKQPEADKSDDKKDSAGGGGDKSAQQQPAKEGEKEKKPAAGPKDLTVTEGGQQVTIKGGTERRLYEQRELARQELGTTRTQLNDTRSELERVRGEMQTLRATVQSVNGADPRDVAIGVNIVRDLQRDPVGTMKKLLAEVVAQGHTIEGIGAGVDQLAIQRMLDERLGTQQSQNEPSEAEILAEAEREATQFFTQYPDAKPHDALLAKVLSDNPGMELPTAYFQLKNAFVEKGFDWSLTLEDNLKAQSDNTGSSQQSTDNKAPMTDGRGSTTGMHPAKEVKIAHEDADMSDIVREAMRESGLNV